MRSNLTRLGRTALAALTAAGIVAGATACGTGDSVRQAVADRLTADMFVEADTDAFDPGIAVGSALPTLRALHAGREVTNLDGMTGSRGTVFVVNRSVDW